MKKGENLKTTGNFQKNGKKTEEDEQNLGQKFQCTRLIKL